MEFPPTSQDILDSISGLPVAQRLALPAPVSAPLCTNVSIIDDDILEQVHTKLFRLELSHPDRAVTFSAPSTAEVIITDDDSKRCRKHDYSYWEN